MKPYQKLCTMISNFLNIDTKYIVLILSTILIILIICIIKKIGSRLFRWIKNERKEFLYNQRLKITLNIIECILLLFIWEDYIESFLTLISFLSAAFAIALRDMILNWFCGIYNRIKKIFKVEDRIEINGMKGDVMMISTLSFEILEVSDKEENGQSTGVIINFPNSIIFKEPIKNITKGFKYIWNETTIKITLNSNLTKTKQEIYKIINSIDEIKSTPKKMRNAISNMSGDYRIYFNQYEPIIYTKVVDDHIELIVRYLIHPKKARFVESKIWNQILVAYQNKKIQLYNKD